MKICDYSFEEYIDLVKSFHGNVAPGLVIGGFMVDYALKNRPEGELFDSICETSSCLPDAIQLLTPCTIGNGWLKIVNLGRYAMTLYEKNYGDGIRIFLDPVRLEPYPEIKNWFLKLKPKKEQNLELLQDEIEEAGSKICSLKRVIVEPQYMEKKKKGSIAICAMCNEAFPLEEDEEICLACKGENPYLA